MTPGQQRAAANYLGETYGVSQRRAGRILGRARSTLRYRLRPRPGEAALIRELRRLARRHPRWGYKRMHARLVKLGLVGQPQARPAAVERTGPAKAGAAKKAEKTGAQARFQRQQLREPTGAVQERRLDLRFRRGPDNQRRSTQVVDLGGRIYSGVLGIGSGQFNDRHGRAARAGASHRPTRGADTHPQRQRLGVHLRRAGGTASISFS